MLSTEIASNFGTSNLVQTSVKTLEGCMILRESWLSGEPHGLEKQATKFMSSCSRERHVFGFREGFWGPRNLVKRMFQFVVF